jgi:hypothetical protein
VAVLDGDDYSGVPTEEGLYRIDAGPYLTMLELDDYRDLAQALWFLRQLIDIVPESARSILFFAKEHLPRLLTHERDVVRHEARLFVQIVDPEKRTMPAEDAPAPDQLAWFDAVIYDVFPPIRPISEGLTELYPSEDLERIIAVGRDVLSRSAIGERHQGRLPGGTHYRGFKVMRLPEPLDRLGIPLDATITAINGSPVTDGKSVLAAVERYVEAKQDLMVEYVDQGEPKVMEYRLR